MNIKRGFFVIVPDRPGVDYTSGHISPNTNK